jgi:hypothetical protein
MQDSNGWRVGRPEDSREILSKSFPITTPSEAYTKATAALANDDLRVLSVGISTAVSPKTDNVIELLAVKQ